MMGGSSRWVRSTTLDIMLSEDFELGPFVVTPDLPGGAATIVGTRLGYTHAGVEATRIYKIRI